MSAFWSMVKLNYQMIIPKKFLFYLFLILGFTIGTFSFYTFTSFETVESHIHWFFLWVLFTIPGFASSLIYNEWTNKTHHWFLSLPYPRWWILLSKYVAILLQILLILAIASAIPYLTLYLYSQIDSTFAVNWSALQSKYFEVLPDILVYFPYLITLGIFASTVLYSPFRNFSGLLWLLFGLTCPIIVLRQLRHTVDLDWTILQVSPLILLPISLCFSLLFFLVTNYLMKQKIQI
jgi:ABC-type transport system involved in multi-copper enzyme maturation permease subunit